MINETVLLLIVLMVMISLIGVGFTALYRKIRSEEKKEEIDLRSKTDNEIFKMYNDKGNLLKSTIIEIEKIAEERDLQLIINDVKRIEELKREQSRKSLRRIFITFTVLVIGNLIGYYWPELFHHKEVKELKQLSEQLEIEEDEINMLNTRIDSFRVKLNSNYVEMKDENSIELSNMMGKYDKLVEGYNQKVHRVNAITKNATTRYEMVPVLFSNMH